MSSTGSPSRSDTSSGSSMVTVHRSPLPSGWANVASAFADSSAAGSIAVGMMSPSTRVHDTDTLPVMSSEMLTEMSCRRVRQQAKQHVIRRGRDAWTA